MYTCRSSENMLDILPFKCRPLLSANSCKSWRKGFNIKNRQQPNNYFKMHRGACWTTFRQFHHALLHGGSSQNWHLMALIKGPNRAVTFWKECFRWFQWQRARIWDSASKAIDNVRVCLGAHASNDRGPRTLTFVMLMTYKWKILFTSHSTYL